MGIRFRCHHCGHELHVKDFQGGKRSKCPECETRFRIPVATAERSIPLDSSLNEDSAQSAAAATSSTGVAIGTLPASSTMAVSGSRKSDVPIDSPNQDQEEIATAGVDLPKDRASQLQAILEAPEATWYVRPPAGGQYGPAPADIFCEWLAEHRVTRDSLVWRDGWPQWLVAGDVFTDYFGPETTYAAAPAPVAEPSPAPGMERSLAPGFVAPSSLSDRAIAARKRQRKKNYVIMIGILAAISVGLVIALVVVLMQNS